MERYKAYLEGVGDLAKILNSRAMGEVMVMLEYEIKERVRVFMDLEARWIQADIQDPYGTVKRIMNELFSQEVSK